MNGRELFEIYAEEAALSHDSHRPYWDFLIGSDRDLWNRIAKRLAANDPLAGIEVYEVDGSRYSTKTGDPGPFVQPSRPYDREQDDYPLGPGRSASMRASNK